MLRTLLLAGLVAGLAFPDRLLAQTAAPANPATSAIPEQTTTTPPGRRPRAASPASPTAPTPAVAPTVPPPARPAAAAPAATAAQASRRVDVNGAGEDEIAALPGIGPASAKLIVQGRPWDDLADLVKKNAITQAVYDRAQAQLALANVNTSSAADLARTLPGIGPKTAPKIVNARPYATPHDMVIRKAISERQYARIKDLVAF